MSLIDIAKEVNSAVLDVFGEDPVSSSIILDRVGGPLEIRGVFEAQREVLDLGSDGAEVAGYSPALFVDLDQLVVVPERGDVLTIRGDRYRVRDRNPDGQGGCWLLLHKA
ncbi:head-tail joining protein [Kiloniella laminariae]|uniref:head-tail joining protein n=1 Tax=Kiloniella laminariae TaxID=454162 RepID=UPI0003820343|nr:head-tail joining protein [Kiloniella laminariae]